MLEGARLPGFRNFPRGDFFATGVIYPPLAPLAPFLEDDRNPIHSLTTANQESDEMPVVKPPTGPWTAPLHRPRPPEPPASPTAEVLGAVRELRATVEADRRLREELLVEMRALGRHLAVLSASTFVRLDEHRRQEVAEILLDGGVDVEAEELAGKRKGAGSRGGDKLLSVAYLMR